MTSPITKTLEDFASAYRMGTHCPHLIVARCHDCPDVCKRSGQPVDEDDCRMCQTHQELGGDCERDER